jgi:hypothetical protein
MPGFGPFDSYSETLIAACPVILSKPNATAGRVGSQDFQIRWRISSEYCAWVYYTPDQKYEMSLLTDQAKPGTGTKKTCILPPFVDDPRYPASSIKYIFAVHNHPFEDKLSDDDFETIVGMGLIHGFESDTNNGTARLEDISLKKISLGRLDRGLHLTLFLVLTACLRSPYPRPLPVGDDTSIRFPEFHDSPAIQVGETGAPYQLDGITLRAIMIAANDYIPPGTQEQDCLDRQEAQLYRVIRQGDIIFVSVSFNFSFCKPRAYPLDGGARYAISTDGRILRRLVGIEPDGFPREEHHGESIPVPNHLVGSSFEDIRAWMRDAGVPDAGVPVADGGVPTPDGGLSAASWDGGT